MVISHCYWHLIVNNGNFTPFNTIRGQSDLFTVQCCHWHSKADIPPIQHYQRTEWSLHCSMLSLTLKGRYTLPFNTFRGQSDLFTVQFCHWHAKANIPPWSKLAEDRVISLLFNVVIDTQRQIYPPRSTLSEDRVISLLFNVVIDIQRQTYAPHSTLSEDRVISSLFNVVIDTQRKIYPPSQQ